MTASISIAQERSGADVAVAIISSRESTETLGKTVAAALRALEGFNAVLDVVVNGNQGLAESLVSHLRTSDGKLPAGVGLRCWSLPCGDKAHAWNTYVHQLWPGARTTVFMDGYVEPAADAFLLLDKGLAENLNALGATGVPSVGASARRMRREMTSAGGIHGNLFAIRADAMHMVREAKFFVPMGLYRVDAVIGAALFKQCQPLGTTWDVERIVVLPAVSWNFDPLKWWRIKDLIAYLKRRSRQQQGKLENLAFRDFFMRRQQSLDKLPQTALGLVEGWVRHAPDEAGSVLKRSSVARRALGRMRFPRDWSMAVVSPTLLLEMGQRAFKPANGLAPSASNVDQ